MEPAKTKGMNRNSRQLCTHLMIAVPVKLVALVLIWWFFIRGDAVDINAEQMASHLHTTSQGVSK